ncbi:MAG TPA: hypothetical protein PLJ21_10565 [Pseudobdellovibrionaceae bacterium]|nr:hypothetical protein [Pseudobdellovibrionaceae bacterium]
MRKFYKPFKNLFLLMFIFIFFLTIEKILWSTFFTSLQAPPLWLNFVVFIALFRPVGVGIFFTYFLGWILSFYTLAPLKLILFTMITVYGISLFIKTRLFMEGFFYFSVLSTIATINFHLSWLIFSYLFETQSAPLDLVYRLIQILLTPALAFPIYYFLIRFDRLFTYYPDGESGPVNL